VSRMDIDPNDPLTDIHVVAAILDAEFPPRPALACLGKCGRTVPSGEFTCGQCGTDDEVLVRMNAQRDADATGYEEPDLCSHGRLAEDCGLCEEIRYMERMLRAEDSDR
jgi:hypothetical protein